jgi:hypothetical protein
MNYLQCSYYPLAVSVKPQSGDSMVEKNYKREFLSALGATVLI